MFVSFMNSVKLSILNNALNFEYLGHHVIFCYDNFASNLALQHPSITSGEINPSQQGSGLPQNDLHCTQQNGKHGLLWLHSNHVRLGVVSTDEKIIICHHLK